MLPTTVVRGRANPLHWKFSVRLRRARKAAGMHAEALSLAAGMSKGIVSNLEARVEVPRLYTVERLSDALKLSPALLAYGIESEWEPAQGLRSAGMAARAKEARILCGLSLREVGRRAETSEANVRAIEGGTRPTLDTIELLAKALGVSPAWLAFGIGPRELRHRRVSQELQGVGSPSSE